MAVQKVELHALAQYLLQIGKVAPTLRISIVNKDLAIFCVGCYRGGIERAHDTTDIALIDAELRGLGLQVDRQQLQQTARHILVEDGRDEQGDGSQIIVPVVERIRGIGIGQGVSRASAGLLDGPFLVRLQSIMLAHEVNLRKEVSKGATLRATALGSRQREDLVQLSEILG